MAKSDFKVQSNAFEQNSKNFEQKTTSFRSLEEIMGIWAARYKKAIARPGAATMDRLDGVSIKDADDPSSFGPLIFDAKDARDVALDMSEKEVRQARALVFRLAQMDSAQLAALRVTDPAVFANYDDDIANIVSYASALKAFAEEISARKTAVTR